MENSDTKKKIQKIGKQEFLKKGFKDASLNHIVAKAGFTKGAFYGYYPDKAALFEDLVSDAADGLMDQFNAAQYDHFDAFKLVLCCADGTKYENYVNDFVELDVARTEQYYDLLRDRGKSWERSAGSCIIC